jgi:hypothetical protein
MPTRGYVTLAEITDRQPVLDVACDVCGRRGRLNTRRLIRERGPDFPVPELRQVVAADFPRMIEDKRHAPCRVRFPGLAG